MKTVNIELIETADYGSYVLPNMYAYYAEAAAICFEENDFRGNVSLKIEDKEKEIATFHFAWKPLTEQIKDMRNDLVEETEYAAYCIAFLMIHHLTNYQVIRRSKRKTGFDYWLGDKEAEYPFEDTARLEVSGILKAKTNEITQRIKSKKEQTKQSDSSKLLAYIIVTEFSTPISKLILKRWVL